VPEANWVVVVDEARAAAPCWIPYGAVRLWFVLPCACGFGAGRSGAVPTNAAVTFSPSERPSPRQ
jgi:hypothetical protein